MAKFSKTAKIFNAMTVKKEAANTSIMVSYIYKLNFRGFI
jgi:ABC-type sugar transport system permease subunit